MAEKQTTIDINSAAAAAKAKEAAASAAANNVPNNLASEWMDTLTNKYPAKLKTIIWNCKERSVQVYEQTPGKTMKYIALGTAVVLFLGILSLVLAHQQSSRENDTIINGRLATNLPFTLEDAIPVRSIGNPKISRVQQAGTILFGVPGEALKGEESNPQPSAPTTTSAPILVVPDDKDDKAEKESVTTSNNQAINETGSPAEGTITITASSSSSSDDEEKEDDQRIVFIERLMGLHLAAGPLGAGEEKESESSSDKEEGKRVRWSSTSRVVKKVPPTISESIIMSGPADNDQPIPHPMLRYAAAAMMSRLIAAAARAQMEAQAREAIMMGGSRPSGKDKDDDIDEESVPVLLASLRPSASEEMPATHRGYHGHHDRRDRHMYGRPSFHHGIRNSRGPLDLDFPPPPSRMMMGGSGLGRSILPPGPMGQGPVNPMIHQLQALQILSAIQRMRQREEMRASPSEMRSGPALVMLAIPIQGDQRMEGPIPVRSPPPPQYRSYYGPYSPGYAAYHRPSYGPSYAHPPPQPIHPAASYGYPVHAVPPPPRHHGYPAHHGYYQGYPQPHHPYPLPSAHQYHHLPPPPAQYPHHQPSRHQASVPAYSNVRPVIEVPVEVPIPVHVPVPVPYPAATTGHASSGHAGIHQEGADGQNGGDSDQIVLLYDADINEGHEEGAQNSNLNNHQIGQLGRGSSGASQVSQPQDQNGDDLQSSASSESKIIYGKSHAFLSTSSVPMVNPSAAKMKLYREMMAQKHASQPGIRYMPVSMSSEVERPQFGQGGQQQPVIQASASPSATANIQATQRSAFIVVQEEGNNKEQPQAVERR